jgi:hypothetical protein
MTDIVGAVSKVQRQAQVTPFTRIPRRFYQGTLTASSTTLYTAPSAPTVANSVGQNPKAHIKQIRVTNTDTSARTFTLYLVPSGGSVGATNTIHSAVTIAANTDYIYDGLEDILEAGDTIRGLASVTSVVCVSISGDELL